MSFFGDIKNTLSIAAGKAVRRNSGDTAFETYTPLGYSLTLTATAQSAPTDGQTDYWGGANALAPQTTEGRCRVFIPKTGTVKAIYIVAFAGTAGSAEAWSQYFRLNATTDTLIETTTETTSNRRWTNTGLSIAVTAGDSFEIKSIAPTWATDPVNLRYTGVVYIET